MHELVLPLAHEQASDAHLAGRKAASLARLLRAGFPVPPGLCVTTTAFQLAMQPFRGEVAAYLRAHGLHEDAAAQDTADRIAALLSNLSVPTLLMDTIAALWSHVGSSDGPLAVRSSATAEDSIDSSYAGQYTTQLGVRRVTLPAAILAVWRSFFSANALVARATHGALGSAEGMALLIQPLIEAEVAGVCFTVDPVQARRDQIVVNAAWGLGVGVVDGSVPSDTYWLNRAGFDVARRDIPAKPQQMTLAQDGFEETTVPEDQQHAICLPDAWARRIAQFGLAAELVVGRPKDVEWAVADGRVWVLQSRPITALPAELAETPLFPVGWQDEAEARALWRLEDEDSLDRGPLPPLEQDHILIREAMREETCRFMGADRNQETRIINGRAYLRPLPLPISAGDFRLRRQAQQDLGERLHREGRTTWEYWGREVETATARLRAFDRAAADGPALADHLDDALAARRRHYMLHPMCSFYPHPAFFAAYQRVSGRSGPDAEAAAYLLLEGEPTPFTDLVDRLYALAERARDLPAVAALLTNPPADVVQRLAALPEAAPVLALLHDFLAVYGERTGDGYGSEATIATPTWAERPATVLRLAAHYLDPAIEPPAQARAQVRAACEARLEVLAAAGDDAEAVAALRRETAYARRCLAVLEIHNHYIDQMATGQLRTAVMAAAHWLVQQGALDEADDILWLHFAEILAALRSPTPAIDPQTIRQRQAQHRAWAALEAPPILGVPDAALPPRPPLEQAALLTEALPAGQLKGLGASPGQYQGRAHIAADKMVDMPPLHAGDVLVAHNVGPRWTPLFPLLGALVLDTGSLGQHAAAIAREYGIPTVINTRDATLRIPHGAQVTVNGSDGDVRFEVG